MDDVTILHLTDLHFGWDRDPSKITERKLVLDGLAKRVLTLSDNWRPHVVCISGDIGWKGHADDYAAAKIWLVDFLTRLGLGFDSVIVCPGNHDINRAVAERIVRPTAASEADEVLKPPIAAHNVDAFAAFSEFCRGAGITPYMFHGQESYLIGHRRLKGIRFVACNSAWFCKDQQDKGRLWLGLPLIRQIEADGGLALATEPSDEPTVCIVHHPSAWWHEAETQATQGRPNTEDYLARRTDVIVSGHTHGEVRKANRIAQRAIHLTGGAGYSGNDHYNSFRLIRISAGGLDYQSFEFDPRSADGQWRDCGVDSVPFVERPAEGSQSAADRRTHAADLRRLVALSRASIQDVSTALEGLPPLDRTTSIDAVRKRLADHGVCLIAGESGSGKSAVAKLIG